MEITNKEKEYHHENHMVYSCQYHVIFCPKYRRSV
ncbi:MAG: IS200/IS605 family transposase, partial [Thermoplasma sp.]